MGWIEVGFKLMWGQGWIEGYLNVWGFKFAKSVYGYLNWKLKRIEDKNKESFEIKNI